MEQNLTSDLFVYMKFYWNTGSLIYLQSIVLSISDFTLQQQISFGPQSLNYFLTGSLQTTDLQQFLGQIIYLAAPKLINTFPFLLLSLFFSLFFCSFLNQFSLCLYCLGFIICNWVAQCLRLWISLDLQKLDQGLIKAEQWQVYEIGRNK